MSSEEIRKSFLSFFSARGGSAFGGKGKGHMIVSSSSLIPDDPSVLLTTAGMQQFKRYYTGELDAEKDFGTKNAVSIQKCFRTSDIDEVGDKTHLTFFEMLGNFSFGGYFKRESILWAYEYLTKILGISEDRLTVSVFSGDDSAGEGKTVLRDEESFNIWHKEVGLPKEKIRAMGRADNFWGPTGSEGPCGPNTEIYVDGVEVWNLVFNEYYCHADKTLKKLTSAGVDTGMGLERLVSVMQGTDNVFETDLLHPIILKVYELAPGLEEKTARIFADHMRAVSFLISDGLKPGNKEANYILRRLLRRLIAYQIKNKINPAIFKEIITLISKKYSPFYKEIENYGKIAAVAEEERFLFSEAMEKGLKELESLVITGAQDSFRVYSTFGLPFELQKELAPEKTKNIKKEDFEKEFEKHQEISRAGAEKKFGGHGLILNTGELKAGSEEELQKVIRLHTATHLLHQALRDVLGNEAGQAGSDITAERTRFDFTFGRKLTPEEIKEVEDLVNKKIKEDLQVSFQEMPKTEAEKTGALHFFKLKYPEKVKVYFAAPSGKGINEAYSKEFCGGPHVNRSLEIGEFKIIKEEAVGAGVRRIRGIILP
ncbi:MAG: alanine--tRNA ligase [Candidatus Brennerbacteria bacterium]|nr:alanine--tRNA ligase [Candidatus Brennerbacteria bacterium]